MDISADKRYFYYALTSWGHNFGDDVYFRRFVALEYVLI